MEDEREEVLRRVKERQRAMAESIINPQDGKDVVTRAVDRLVELEPSLKGCESKLSVIIVAALSDYLRERGEGVVPQGKRAG